MRNTPRFLAAVEEAGLRGDRVIAVTAWEFPLLVTGLETVSMEREAFARTSSSWAHEAWAGSQASCSARCRLTSCTTVRAPSS
jgi:hypothetical protein